MREEDRCECQEGSREVALLGYRGTCRSRSRSRSIGGYEGS